MAKVTSLQGKATGKVGSIVYSVSGGQMVAREYNPNVANPNTVSQMNQRARLKLASQLAAALSPVIVMVRDGLVTPRNKFIKANIDYITANNGTAIISYENIQLTEGTIGIPAITAERNSEGKIAMSLAEDASAAVSRVVYVVYKKTSENQLQFIDSAIVTDAGDDGKFAGEVVDFDGDVIIWAYGMKDRNASAAVKYGDYSVSTGEDIAQLYMNRSLASSDFQFSKTRGITLFDNESETTDPAVNQNMVYITASGPGTVSGDGFSNGRKAVNEGESVTVVATPSSGCTFLGWKINGTTTYVSYDNEYTFTPTAATDLVAMFNNPQSSTGGGGDTPGDGD